MMGLMERNNYDWKRPCVRYLLCFGRNDVDAETVKIVSLSTTTARKVSGLGPSA